MKSLALLGLLSLCACGTPSKSYYERQPWATMTQEEAEAKCRAEINSIAGFGQSMYLCMRGKGWQERRVQ